MNFETIFVVSQCYNVICIKLNRLHNNQILLQLQHTCIKEEDNIYWSCKSQLCDLQLYCESSGKTKIMTKLSLFLCVHNAIFNKLYAISHFFVILVLNVFNSNSQLLYSILELLVY